MKQYRIILFLLGLIITHHATSQLRLPRLISDGMVLQRNKTIQLWGWAQPKEEVTVSFNGKKVKTKTTDSGKWTISLPPQKAGGPYTMTFKASNEITISNILFGDVWICSGQSNMELEMNRVAERYAAEIASPGNPKIRQFTVPDKYNFNFPEDDLPAGEWMDATGTRRLKFSAVAYFFAKEIYAKYKIPVGLINTALGGSPAEAWISEDALRKFPNYYAEAEKYKNKDLIAQVENQDKVINNNWYKLLNQKDEGLKDNWKDPGFDDAGWNQMNIPGYWATGELGPVNGVVWFRKDFMVPASLADKPAKLELGRIVDADSVFINGVFIGNTTYQYPPRRYEVPAGILKQGKNVMVIKVVSNSGRGGFVLDKPYYLKTKNDSISLTGSWKYKPGAFMDALPGQTFIRWKPMGLYNAMIAPLVNYPIKGVIWYQGEANTRNPAEYSRLMETLITNWRLKWKQGNFPFLFVQLANFMESKSAPSESNWAATRQAQLNTLAVANTGMAVAIDLGDWNDIHPENKKDVGLRLALLAKRLAYGETKIISSGPLYHSMKREGKTIVLSFTNTGSGLINKGGLPLKYFSIAGPDNKYVWANAEIKGNKVIVWSDEVPEPVAVRYAWADNPAGANLYNREGLPASPFGTTPF